MKKIFSLFLMLLSINSIASPGKQEFSVLYDDGELRFINDGNRMVVLEITTTGKVGQSKEVKCGVSPIENNKSIFGPNNITFGPNYATVNNKLHYYESTKTELLFYNELCPKIPKKKKK